MVVCASDGILRGELEIYANADDLNRVADGLIGFPNGDDDTYTWELGSEDENDRFAFYFRFRVFPTSPTGRCAVELRFNNNEAPPNQKVTEFCIDAYPADLDRLGALFRQFRRLKESTMEWTAQPGT